MSLLSGKCGMLAAAMLVFAGSAAWAAPIGTLTCSPIPATETAVSITAHVSSYVVTIQNTVDLGSGSTGGGAGKVTFNPADIHVSLSKFSEFYPIAVAGTAFQQCTLVATAGNGVTATYTFNLAAIKSVSAVAAAGDDRNGEAYTDVQLVYGGLAVTMTNAVDDGGTNPQNSGGRD